MEQRGVPTSSGEFAHLAHKVRAAIGSVHCRLQPRAKKVIEQLVRHSYDLGRDEAFVGSSQMLAIMAEIDEGDASNALSMLESTQLIQARRAGRLYKLRRPMLYRLMPEAILRTAQSLPAAPLRQKAKQEVGAWLVAVNRAWPLQCEYIPPDPKLLDDALAELSRQSALADYPTQNEAPKPGAPRSGEVVTSEGAGLPGPTHHQENDGRGEVTTRKTLSRQIEESLYGAGGKLRVVGDSPTMKTGSSWKSSNYPRAGALDVEDGDKDGDINIPSSRHLDGDGLPVGNSPTGDGKEPAVQYIFVPVKSEEEAARWKAPTKTGELFAELMRCMGEARGIYGSFWLDRCHDSAADVAETIAQFKTTITHPRATPWGGGKWRDKFNENQKRRRREEATREGAAVP